MSSKRTDISATYGRDRNTVTVNGRTRAAAEGESPVVLPNGKTITVPAGAKVSFRDGVVYVNGKKVG
ncbi:hypothetical protein Ae406Ps2_3017c [Pseudonocardia sp. Ae406_Ps2]|uniref:hypothetical protein n=1 Tax=unclassified Pseudonocardia TaxID=2619320 RepID=UPI00094B5225|nr:MULTISPECIES: hypothetical protein [unclassified Pseudonocardia]OLL99244.1 hypothetical protein Ae331Ps2_2911 [Pseudonocardia sp. Ae331_Ps2]OLM03017.1 hypothetical protein Ae406Ps2_3017c [Pseudonocardia sp. Ae406_Ps2]OLM12129.1 hypothetical protein Ae505Ps2_2256 [Pseudonocardia sp. Ae505_Ps2]